MAIVTDTVIVELQAKLDQYNTNVMRAAQNFEKGMDRVERSAVQAQRRVQSSSAIIGSSMRSLIGGFAGGIAAGFSVRAMQTMTDNAIKVRNALRLAGHSGEELDEVYQSLFESAQKNLVPINSMVELYSKVALAQDELNVNSEQMREFTDSVGVALRASGTDANAAAGALTQLGQAMGGGVVRAEEFNSMLEGAPGLIRAAAMGLVEAEGSVSALRNIMLDGKLSSEAFFHAMVSGASQMEAGLQDAEITISGAFVRLQNVLQDLVGKFDDGTGGSAALAEALSDLADSIGEVDFDGIAGGLADFIGTVRTGVEWVLNLTEKLNELGRAIGSATGLDRVGKSYEDTLNRAKAQSRVDQAFDTATIDTSKSDKPTAADVTVIPEIVVKPRVSLSDYELPTGGGGGGRGSRRGGGGGGGRGRGGGRADAFERETEQIKERIALLTAETEMMRGLNPLIDDYGYSLEKARSVQELLNAAKKAGIEVTPALRENIEQLAEQYAAASAEANKLAEEQDKVRQNAEEMRALGRDVMGGFIQDLREGKSGAEALANALQKVADKLLDMALNSLFSGGGGGGFGGFLGGIFKLFGFAKGGVAAYGKPQPLKTYSRGGVSNTAAIFGEAGPEAAVPLPDGRRIPVDLRTPGPAQRTNEVIKVVLQDDSGRMAEIADQRIATQSGPMLEVSVARSANVSRKGLPSASGYYQKRGVI